MGVPVGPKLSKGAAPRREALRATRTRGRDRHRVEKVGSNPESCPNDPKMHFWMDENIDLRRIGLTFIN